MKKMMSLMRHYFKKQRMVPKLIFKKGNKTLFSEKSVVKKHFNQKALVKAFNFILLVILCFCFFLV